MKIITEQDLTESQVVDIQSATYIGDFAIRLFFSDGHQKLVDFKPFLELSVHPSICKYLDEVRFQRFRIIDGNLNWHGFDLIFAIEDLYNGEI